MQYHFGFDHLPPLRNISATVGSYDGVHSGHRVLLDRVRREAEQAKGESLVVTFSPHPRLALDPMCDMQLLTSQGEKLHLLEQAGMDHVLVIPFDRTFSRTEPLDFIRMLVRRAGVKRLIVGYDHRFGCNQRGNFQALEQHQADLGLQVIRIEEQEVEHEHVSSTVIRRLISEGKMEHAGQLLGHPYLLEGELFTDGSYRIDEPHKLLPPEGNYAIRYGNTNAILRLSNRGTSISSPQSLPLGRGLACFIGSKS